ncbi:MAG: redoxin domain-containing protein [Pirellulales bacterium]|nr:redoxin domain-containing protein [Pirellulales bacterium]
MRTPRALVVVFALASTFGGTSFAAEAESRLGRPIENFTLSDFRGTEHSLDALADKKLVVVAFLGTECPLAKLYAPRLAALAEEYGPQGVAFLGIDSNRQDAVTEMNHYARDAKLNFPLLKDTGNVVADQFQAERTPEVFLLDADRQVRYAGRIDDQFGVGYQKNEPTRRDLAVALDEALAGKAISVPHVEAAGCLIGRVRDVKPGATVTYSNQIARIFQQHCVECHRPGQVAPFSLTDYSDAVGWADMIAEVVREQRMPPWHADPKYGHFSNDIRLTDDEQQMIYEWAAAGAPEGDRADLPEPQQYVDGWLLPKEPDQIVYMSDDAYTVPAEGVVDYQYFTVDPGFAEDKWIRVAECMPGNRRVVHHIIVFVRPPAGASGSGDPRGFHFLAGFAPGTRPFVYPDNMAKRIPAGSKLVFQMHYTPCGEQLDDRSSIGLVFVDDPTKVQYQVATVACANNLFQIPPGADNHKINSSKKFRDGATILSFFPHMHVRGKSFRYEVVQPDGSSEIVLDVPRYDFNWQNHFILAEPLQLPPKSKLFCTAHYDNSENNPANPDPTKAVRWGDQTWEEMMIGWFDMAVPVGEKPSLDEDGADPENDKADRETGGQ